MTLDELRAKWEARATELARYDARVDGARLLADVCADLDQLARHAQETFVALGEAARVSGYSTAHLGRLLREGKLRNFGSKRRPRVRRADLPRKPGAVASGPAVVEIPRAGRSGSASAHTE